MPQQTIDIEKKVTNFGRKKYSIQAKNRTYTPGLIPALQILDSFYTVTLLVNLKRFTM